MSANRKIHVVLHQKQLVVHRVKNTAKKEKKEGNTKGSEEEVRKEETRV